jgi:hypothetical protein
MLAKKLCILLSLSFLQGCPRSSAGEIEEHKREFWAEQAYSMHRSRARCRVVSPISSTALTIEQGLVHGYIREHGYNGDDPLLIVHAHMHNIEPYNISQLLDPLVSIWPGEEVPDEFEWAAYMQAVTNTDSKNVVENYGRTGWRSGVQVLSLLAILVQKYKC